MRPVWLALTVAASFCVANPRADASPQFGTPSQSSPPTKPAGPAGPCYVLKPVRIPGENHQWARVLTGDKWISGCIGPVGACHTSYWAPC